MKSIRYHLGVGIVFSQNTVRGSRHLKPQNEASGGSKDNVCSSCPSSLGSLVSGGISSVPSSEWWLEPFDAARSSSSTGLRCGIARADGAKGHAAFTTGLSASSSSLFMKINSLIDQRGLRLPPSEIEPLIDCLLDDLDALEPGGSVLGGRGLSIRPGVTCGESPPGLLGDACGVSVPPMPCPAVRRPGSSLLKPSAEFGREDSSAPGAPSSEAPTTTT
mmetsp:Transcript_52491/g.98411  ORF Transcript_52491/g.98411 Transcript_52491/m.98411 type:complete len:219 (-) Transcript_52491:706-1362(-)